MIPHYPPWHISQEILNELQGKRVRITIIYEGVLERPDYGNEIVLLDGTTRYIRKSDIASIIEQHWTSDYAWWYDETYY